VNFDFHENDRPSSCRNRRQSLGEPYFVKHRIRWRQVVSRWNGNTGSPLAERSEPTDAVLRHDALQQGTLDRSFERPRERIKDGENSSDLSHALYIVRFPGAQKDVERSNDQDPSFLTRDCDHASRRPQDRAQSTTSFVRGLVFHRARASGCLPIFAVSLNVMTHRAHSLWSVLPSLF